MTKGIFIVATDTDAGKTFITGGLIYALRKNKLNATYFKGALSGAKNIDETLIPGDTEFVCSISNLDENYELLTPYIYEEAVSPHLAARLNKKPIEIDIIKKNYEILKNKYDYIVAEGSGGIVCPLRWDSSKLLLEDLIKELSMDVILVTKATLGTINHTVLTVKYLEFIGIKVKGIIVNMYDENDMCHRDNIEMIKELTGKDILGVVNDFKGTEEENIESLKSYFNTFNIEKLTGLMKEI
ncbi:MAG: dethiobiotin synthase [Clostridium perfringens]|nr:dethiobiotin synthase [Clostridium perfringens]